MWAVLGDLRQVMGSQQFWKAMIKLAVLVSFGLAILLVAFTTLLILLPLMLAGGLALHFYIRRKLRQAARRPSPHRHQAQVIEAEYTIIERR